MVKILTTKDITRINKELTLAKIGSSHKAKKHIDIVLEIINGKEKTQNQKKRIV